MKELICIVCPKGCHLHVDEGKGYEVSGNGCPRGAEYGKKELTAPTRVLTTTVCIHHALQPRVSVKTSCDVAKGILSDIMKELDSVELEAPVKRGDIVIAKVCGSEADIIVTKDLERITS